MLAAAPPPTHSSLGNSSFQYFHRFSTDMNLTLTIGRYHNHKHRIMMINLNTPYLAHVFKTPDTDPLLEAAVVN